MPSTNFPTKTRVAQCALRVLRANISVAHNQVQSISDREARLHELGGERSGACLRQLYSNARPHELISAVEVTWICSLLLRNHKNTTAKSIGSQVREVEKSQPRAALWVGSSRKLPLPEYADRERKGGRLNHIADKAPATVALPPKATICCAAAK